MKDPYFSRQLFMIGNHILLIVYLCIMWGCGLSVGTENTMHVFLLSLLFFDAAYISYKNIKNSPVLNHFAYLQVLLGWQFVMSLFISNVFSNAASILLLPICLYQAIYFLQAFVFQSSNYQGQKGFLLVMKIICTVSTVSVFLSSRAFALSFLIQSMVALGGVIIIGILHHKRVVFFIKSQKKELLISAIFVLLPFACYVAVFYNNAEYLSQMGSYLTVFVPFVSVHRIVFQYHPEQERFVALKKWAVLSLAIVGIVGVIGIGILFQIGLTAILLNVYVAVLLILLFNLLLYIQISRSPKDFDNPVDRQHFYAYSLEQIKREEALKKDFSNYLHDNVLQDLLSIKNLLGKAERPEVQKLLNDTLSELTASLRSQMQVYHPALLKSLTLKGNIQNLLDTLTASHTSLHIQFDCSDTFFLVEPYNTLVYRIIQELITNVLKHAKASKVQLLLTLERDMIILKVSDDGIGYIRPADSEFSHRGLNSIQEQVRLLNGEMNIQSAPGHGTKITIAIPMKGENSYESFIDR